MNLATLKLSEMFLRDDQVVLDIVFLTRVI